MSRNQDTSFVPSSLHVALIPQKVISWSNMAAKAPAIISAFQAPEKRKGQRRKEEQRLQDTHQQPFKKVSWKLAVEISLYLEWPCAQLKLRGSMFKEENKHD